jgi:hypothetical protein
MKTSTLTMMIRVLTMRKTIPMIMKITMQFNLYRNLMMIIKIMVIYFLLEKKKKRPKAKKLSNTYSTSLTILITLCQMR